MGVRTTALTTVLSAYSKDGLRSASPPTPSLSFVTYGIGLAGRYGILFVGRLVSCCRVVVVHRGSEVDGKLAKVVSHVAGQLYRVQLRLPNGTSVHLTQPSVNLHEMDPIPL